MNCKLVTLVLATLVLCYVLYKSNVTSKDFAVVLGLLVAGCSLIGDQIIMGGDYYNDRHGNVYYRGLREKDWKEETYGNKNSSTNTYGFNNVLYKDGPAYNEWEDLAVKLMKLIGVDVEATYYNPNTEEYESAKDELIKELQLILAKQRLENINSIDLNGWMMLLEDEKGWIRRFNEKYTSSRYY